MQAVVGFANDIMDLTEAGERDTIPIGDPTLFNVMFTQELCFQLGD